MSQTRSRKILLLIILLLLATPGISPHQKPSKKSLKKTTSKVSKNKQSDSLAEALKGKKVPDKIRDSLKLVNIRYYGYDSLEHKGQLIMHKALAKDAAEIFDSLFVHKFPIAKIKPMSSYGWDDDSSMVDNNTSCFNYRNAANSKRLSLHAYGRAVDINPKDNPYILKNKVSPPNAKYDAKKRGTILKDSYIYKLFKKHGWKWGGDWKSLKDYQHFEK